MAWIGVDIMGGDEAPHACLEGAYRALNYLAPEVGLALIGPAALSEALGAQFPDRIRIVEAPEQIAMTEDPVKAMRLKPLNTIALGMRALAANEIDVFCTAGHSGAVLAGASSILGLKEGVSRPSLGVTFTTPQGQDILLLDVGLNPECRTEHLLGFAQSGSSFYRSVFGLEHPRVALLNNGREEGKGPRVYRHAHRAMEEDAKLNFVGNCETRSLFSPPAEVLVCDGFVGNLILKQMEAFHSLLEERGGLQEEYFAQFDPVKRGGLPLLGVNAPVLIGHGASNSQGFCQLIRAAEREL